MKTLFIPTTLKLNKEILKKINIKGSFEVVTTIQYLDEVKKYFPKAKQILGCSKLKKANNYLYIGTGKFHPLRLAKFTKNIFILNTDTEQFYKLSQEEIDNQQKLIKGKLIKYYSANKYGIIISIKPGQYNLDKALKLSSKLKKPSYLFLTDNVNLNELENFQDIDCWINTACPRIEGKSIINIEDLPLKL